MHFITGGNDHEQQREGDYLRHDERYDRTCEYIQIVKRVWSEREPFDHSGTYYQFSDFVADVFPPAGAPPDDLLRRIFGCGLRGGRRGGRRVLPVG